MLKRILLIPFNWFARYCFEVSRQYNESMYSLQTLWVDKSGEKIYTFADENLPNGRVLKTLQAMNDAQLSMTKERQQLYFEEMKKALNKNDYVRAGTLAELGNGTLNMFSTEKMLLDLACVFTVLDGEPEDKFLDSWQEKKKRLFEKDHEMRDFFLGFAYKKIQSSTKLSIGSILSKIREEATARELYQSILFQKRSDTLKNRKASTLK